MIAHILNGVINRPARDAMLLHHALIDLMDPPPPTTTTTSSSNKHTRLHRHELLTSRLVRLHWDRMHLARVKREYEERYRRELEDDVDEATRGEVRGFCEGLCRT